MNLALRFARIAVCATLLLPLRERAAATLVAQEPCPRASGGDAEAGWAAFGAGDMSAARARFDAALERCPDDLYARTGLGYVLLRASDLEGAQALWETVVAGDPSNVDALTGLGLVAWRTGQLDLVRARFEAVLEHAPGHPMAREYLARLEGSRSVAAADPADEAWTRGDTARARALYEERLASLGAQPSPDPTPTIRLALMRAWRGRYEDALMLLDPLVASRPADFDARLARARVHAWRGDFRRARLDVLEVIALQPDHREALEALALFESWQGAYDRATELYDALLAISPNDRQAEVQRARTRAWAGDYDAAIAALRALLERDSTDVAARLGLAQTLAYAGRLDAALLQYDEALATSPGDVRGWAGKARALGWARRLVPAEEAALEAVRRDSTYAEGWSVLALVLRWQRRWADALHAAETATRVLPSDPELADQLRSLRSHFRPGVRPVVVHERDSDDNRMTTTLLASSWHVVPRLELGAVGFHKDLRQGVFVRSASGVSVSGTYELRPGWLLSAGVGGSRSNGAGDPAFLEGQASVRTPDRHPYGATVAFSSAGLHETAALAQRGVRSTEVSVAARWYPARAWQLDGSVGLGRWSGTEGNGRRSASIAASTDLGSALTVGLSARGFSFEKDLDDGYFDPDFYGIAEISGRWQSRPGSWGVVLELAPGLQRAGSGAEASASIRASARVAYGVGPGREVWLAAGYSSAGLTSFATGASGYRYTAFMLGSSWAF